MSCEFSNSESSSECDISFNEDLSLCNDLIKLKPYLFEPIVSSSSSDENEVVDASSCVEVEEASNDLESHRVGNIVWCLCKCCEAMDSEVKSLCCQETNEFPEELFQGKNCITLSDDFTTVCLTKCVLETNMSASNVLKGESMGKENKNYRYAGYRQFIYLIHSYPGKGVRRVIPSRVVSAIRKAYPSEDNIYVPFKHSEIKDD